MQSVAHLSGHMLRATTAGSAAACATAAAEVPAPESLQTQQHLAAHLNGDEEHACSTPGRVGAAGEMHAGQDAALSCLHARWRPQGTGILAVHGRKELCS